MRWILFQYRWENHLRKLAEGGPRHIGPYRSLQFIKFCVILQIGARRVVARALSPTRHTKNHEHCPDGYRYRHEKPRKISGTSCHYSWQFVWPAGGGVVRKVRTPQSCLRQDPRNERENGRLRRPARNHAKYIRGNSRQTSR